MRLMTGSKTKRRASQASALRGSRTQRFHSSGKLVELEVVRRNRIALSPTAMSKLFAEVVIVFLQRGVHIRRRFLRAQPFLKSDSVLSRLWASPSERNGSSRGTSGVEYFGTPRAG